MANFKELPQGYEGVDLNTLQGEARDEALRQVFDNLKHASNYQGAYGNSESFDDWKHRLDIANPAEAGEAAVRIYAVRGPDGAIAGFSYAELYPGGTALIGYTCGDVGKQGKDYDNVIAATKRGIAEIIKAPGGTFQEHMLGMNKAKHEAKGMVGEEIGQLPLVIEGVDTTYTIPIYKGDVYSVLENQSDTDNAAQIADKVALASPEQLQKAASEASVATLLMADPKVTGANPQANIADVLENYIKDYTAKNSVFKDTPEKDPGYQSVMQMVDKIRGAYPLGLTVERAYGMSAAAANKLDLNKPNSIISEAFNQQANNELQMQAMEIIGRAAQKWEMKDRAVDLLYRGDGSPETLKQGLTLMLAAADDGPEGQKGNFQAMRDLSRFYYEGGINGKSFKELGLEGFIKQDSFHAYQLAQAAKLTYPEKFNDISGIGLDAPARAHVRLLSDMAQDEKLKPFTPALQEPSPSMMAAGQ